MRTDRKVDPEKARQMLAAGIRQCDIARHFRASEVAVYYALNPEKSRENDRRYRNTPARMAGKTAWYQENRFEQKLCRTLGITMNEARKIMRAEADRAVNIFPALKGKVSLRGSR